MRGYAGAALTAVLTGIVVNALTLQHARHPAPFFARPLPVAAPAAPRASAPAAPKPEAQAAAKPETQVAPKPEAPSPIAVLPPERPAGLSAAANPAPPARHTDAIGDILRETAVKGDQREILTAQNELIKLGYSLRADGVADSATLTAMHEFERAHSLPVSNEVTTRLLRHLAAAVAAR
jgi:hypothetical protein